MPVYTPCSWCSEIVQQPPSQVKTRTFCNKECWADWKAWSWESLGFGLDHRGYERISLPGHPLAVGGDPQDLRIRGAGQVAVHRLIIWQENGYSEEILALLKNGASVHHLDGNRINNDPPNLELRIIGHPYGVGERDMVKVLRALGYQVTRSG